MEQTEYYTETTSGQELKLLESLNNLCNPYTRSFLQQQNLIKEGMRVLDVGCATGMMACELAQLVCNTGEVVATEINPERLALSKKLAHEKNINNIKFVQISAKNLDRMGKDLTFDLICCRFVLAHLQHPEITFSQMYRLLKPGGILCCEETNGLEGLFCYPESATYNHWVKIVTEQSKIHEKQYAADYFLGRKLYGLYQKHGMKALSLRTVQPLLVTPSEKIQLRFGTIMAPSTIIDENNFSQDLERLIKDNTHIASFYPYIQVSGIK